MILYYHQTIDSVSGHVKDQHFIDTANPLVSQCLSALKADATKMPGSGWEQPAIHPLALPGETQFQTVMRRIALLAPNDPLKTALGV